MNALLKDGEDFSNYVLTRGRGPLTLIRAATAENAALVGCGLIDGSGTIFADMTKIGTASR
jgi:hypothetical protein